MSLAGDVRAAVATALAGVSATIHDGPVDTPIPPAVVITPGDPWMEPATIGGRLRNRVSLRLEIVVQARNDQLPALETLIEQVLVAIPDAYTVGTVSAPRTLSTGPQGAVSAAEVTVSAHVKES